MSSLPFFLYTSIFHQRKKLLNFSFFPTYLFISIFLSLTLPLSPYLSATLPLLLYLTLSLSPSLPVSLSIYLTPSLSHTHPQRPHVVTPGWHEIWNEYGDEKWRLGENEECEEWERRVWTKKGREMEVRGVWIFDGIILTAVCYVILRTFFTWSLLIIGTWCVEFYQCRYFSYFL